MILKKTLFKQNVIVFIALFLVICFFATATVSCKINTPSDSSSDISEDEVIDANSILNNSDTETISDISAEISISEDEEPQIIMTKGITELNIASLIGDGRRIYYNIPFNNTTIIVVSGSNGADFKLDFIDITKGTLSRKSHKLSKVDTSNFSIGGGDFSYITGDKNLNIIIGRKKSSVTNEYLCYKITFDSDSSIVDELYTTSESNICSLRSDSGRYETFYKNKDLYIHNTITNIDTLVYDSKPDYDSHDLPISVYKGAQSNFFIGDVLYYTLIGWEYVAGIASYNPETAKTTLYKNSLFTISHTDEYIYGQTTVYDNEFYFGRFNINNPQKVEKLIEGDILYSTQIFSTLDGKYIAQISPNTILHNDIRFSDKDNTITIYDALTFTIVKTYNFNIGNINRKSLFVGNYIYIPITDNDNKTYVIKFN